ncbi:cardiomyopathy-associated protein 5 [Danio aesculapii]|uniref:cardiomyopathy-associated protein 5 n=1 Tax=Danio aesculapii TaxID=1142201 RepID=UPI0024C0D795|nr:cardiomyopathy-associated protein 5 [Danio aesculapii]
METMEMMEIQMTALEDEEHQEQRSDELEELSSSLRALVQDGAVKPKLQCVMMDRCFSMVTVQSEDSGIQWETCSSSSRCGTPQAPDLTCSLRSPAAAGSIIFIMDEALKTRRTRRNRSEKTKSAPEVSLEVLAEADRPAMVEVSKPNLTEEPEEHRAETHQQIFSLVSEGSEILNIIAPAGVSTVDEEESGGLEDQLYYLQETPAVKPTETLEESGDLQEQPEECPALPEPPVTVPVPLPHIQLTRRAAHEDYFEKFTLLDSRAPSGAAALEEAPPHTQESGEQQEEMADPPEAEAPSEVRTAVSMLDISGEHLDDVFYGGGGDPMDHDTAVNRGRESTKPSLKESGSALFTTEEPVLTPIFLPEGPPKIIDQILLEEPKALAFLYSDLYADAVGSRAKRSEDEEDEDAASEKSFHSQQSDSEDRGYLEKFVLKVEAPRGPEKILKPEPAHVEPQGPVRLAGYLEDHREKEAAEEKHEEETEEITDFFRNSASSSPCGSAEPEPEEEPVTIRTPRVSFKDTDTHISHPHTLTDDTHTLADDAEEFSDEFLPVEISEDCPAWEEKLPALRAAVVKSDEGKRKPSDQPVQTQSPASQARAVSDPHKPFLDLSVLMPVEDQEEDTAESDEVRGQPGEASLSESAHDGDAGSSDTQLM